MIMRFICIVLFLVTTTSFTHAKEVSDPSKFTPGGADWLLTDRQLWEAQSRKGLSGPDLLAWLNANPNSFTQAAIYNTKNGRSFEYEGIQQRRSYYDYMSLALEFENRAKFNTSEIRFFHAATSVTSQAELGIIDAFLGDVLESSFPRVERHFGVTQESLAFLQNVNTLLFKRNMLVLNDLLYNWTYIKDPRVANPKDRLSALDFDMAMVDLEQTAVEQYIVNSSTADSTINEVSKIISRSDTLPLDMMSTVKKWLRKASFEKRDFSKYTWRVASGRAIVFLFHKKAEQDYLTFMTDSPPRSKDRKSLYNGIQSPEALNDKIGGYFTVVGSWRTEAGALRHQAEIERESLGVTALVYPPYGRDKYWTVVTSTFAEPSTARELMRRARGSGLAGDAFVLRRKPIDSEGREFLPSARSNNFARVPSLIRAAPTETTPELFDSIVTIYEGDATSVERRFALLKSTYPELSLARFKISDDTFAVAIASYVSDSDVAKAEEIARLINIPEDQIRVRSIPQASTISRMDLPESVQTISSVVTHCYQSGKVTVDTLHKCSGYWLTPSALSRCILDSDCRVLDDSVLSDADRINTFLVKQGLQLDTNLELKIADVPIPLDAATLVSNIQECRNASGSNERDFVECMSKTDLSNAALKCLDEYTTASVFTACIAEASNQPELAKVASCVTDEVSDPGKFAVCVAGDQGQRVSEMQDCLASATDETTALIKCASIVTSSPEIAKAKCLLDSAGSADVVACALPDDTLAADLLEGIQCAQSEEATLSETAACLAAVSNSDEAKLAACVAASQTKDAVISCVLNDRPELATARQLYDCATSDADDPVTLIAGCSEGFLDGDTRQFAGCVADNGAETEALVGCAASTVLPEELGPIVECGSSSTGGTDFALCMFGPDMNAEWRIAAECAVNSGGEPVTFASCTAGRLTVRELTKCLSGKIGQDCFGPNNTIVNAYATVFNDLKNCGLGKGCLGEGNDIVKAAKALEKGIGDLGKGAEEVWDDLFGEDTAWCRGDLTSWTC